MSTFYVLPPRPYLADHLAATAGSLFPGLAKASIPWAALADALRDAVTTDEDVFVVGREELPDGEHPLQSLRDGFGAELGDEVIEVRPGARPGELQTRRYRVGETLLI